MILLFQMSTSAGWDGVLDGLINEKDCKDNNVETGVPGDCGNTAMGIAFLLTYLVISFLIINKCGEDFFDLFYVFGSLGFLLFLAK